MKKIFNEKQRLDEILGVIQDEQAWREGDEDTPFEFGEEDELDLDIDDIDTPDEAEYAKLICPESVTLCQGEILDLGAKLDLVQKSGSWFAMGETRLGQGRDAAKQYLKDNPEVDPSWMTMEDVFEMAYDYIDRYHWRGVPEYQEHFISLTEPIIRAL